MRVQVFDKRTSRLDSAGLTLKRRLWDITFLALLGVLLASGPVDLQRLAHHLLAIEGQSLLQILFRCKVNVAKFPGKECNLRVKTHNDKFD